jgi:ubiquitin carboxyl-terminal hydrolase 4/11
MEDEYDYDEDDADDYDDKASDIISGGVAMSTNITVPRRRLYGSGLGNLGNTCFMNSTLQCLAHTEPLQRYFLSGEYERDLNRDNPLGTGGELAIQFAKLLKEMYIVEPPRALLNSNYTNVRTTRYMTAYNTPSNDFSSTSNVVYPRSFKNTLGKHAEQFMGYDQHDSQELATYLLDALHEDTNRVTIKPYVEKPEQGENESDEEAARKAWELHLKREDSRVLENFMGLVKSRVECNTPGCGRVSTTFDPVMYLSVPIPGSSERVLQVTYVPLEPSERPKNLFISIAKTANVGELLKKVQAQVADQFPSLPKSSLEDLCATDISWQKEVNSWFSYKDEIEYIREHDTTFVYELRSEKEIRKLHDEKQNTWEAELATAKRLGVQDCNFVQRYQLDPSVESSLCSDEGWDDAIHNYFQIPAIYSNAFNRRKGITDERVRIYRRLVSLIDTCHKVTEDATATGQKRTREENEQKKKRCASSMLPSQEYNYDIDDTCSNDLTFHNIRSHYDLAVLEFISQKMRTDIVEIERATKNLYPNGIMIEICMRKIGARVKEQPFVAPFLLRIPSDMTVFELRKEIAKRLARSIRPAPGRRESTPSSTGQSTSEVVANVVGQSHLLPTGDDSDTFGPHELLVIRQTPLTYEPKSEVSNGMSHRTHNRKAEQLGSILTDKNGVERPISTLASPSDEEEKNVVSEYISNHDRVYVNWPLELLERSFDAKEYERVDEQSDSSSRMTTSKNKTKSVLDCIDKFCQQEQLEETEQWYCNKCKRHVRAWKQFHLYRSPPHLIVHLKRFHFSPTTHRRNKITALIDFPLKGLDLSEHVIHWSEYNNDKPVYDCYAVTNHFGGLGGGHYTAFALNPDDTWCLYDDSRITTNIDPKEVVSSAAYVLYYRRRDVPATKEFELDLQTGAAIQFSNGLDIAARPALILNDRESKCHTPTSSRSSSIGGSNAAITDDSARVADDDIRGMEGMTFGDDGITDQQDGSRWSPSRDHQDDSLSVEEDDGDGDQYSDAFLSEGQHVVEEEDVNEDNDDDTADRSFLYRNDDISSNSPFDGDDERPSDHIPLQ